MDIVMVGIQAWDIEIGSNSKNLAVEFSKHHRVLYVNYPLDRLTRYKHAGTTLVQNRMKRMHEKKDMEALSTNLWTLYPNLIIEPTAGLPIKSLFQGINRLNNIRFSKAIQKAINTLGFKDFILFNDSDMFRSFHLKELLQPSLSCYYTRDYLLGVPYWHKHGRYMEPALMKKSDLVFANSTYLAEIAQKYNAESHYVGQGCDLTLYDPSFINGEPEDIQPIPAPRIGYTGFLSQLRLDVDILLTIAKNKPNWNLVLIGPEDEHFAKSTLHQLPNVYFLGNKHPDHLPTYIQAFDVAINPQKLNALTIGNYPRKIDEYLALGKPVVATKTKAMSVFEAHTYLAETPEQYVTLIEQALHENTPEKEASRMGFAKEHTWENNVLAIESHLNRKLSKTKPV